MAFATGGGGKVQSRARVFCAFTRSAAETLDGFFAPMRDRCLKRGHVNEEEIRVLFRIVFGELLELHGQVPLDKEDEKCFYFTKVV